MGFLNIRSIIFLLAVALMLIMYYTHPFRYFYKTPYEMFGLTKNVPVNSKTGASIDTSKWQTFRISALDMQLKYPNNFIFTRRSYPEPLVDDDQYATYVFSNKPVLPTGSARGNFEEAAIKSQGLSTLSVEKAFVNFTNNPRRITASVPSDAKNDLRKFVKAWSHINDFSIQNINGIQMLKSKSEGCNLFSADLEGRGFCSYVYFKSKDGNYYFIKIFVNAYDETSGQIFDKMVSTVSLL